MKLGRRRFLKMFGVGVAAAPLAAHGIVNPTAGATDLRALGVVMEASVPATPDAYSMDNQTSALTTKLGRLLGRTAEQHAFFKRRMGVYGLDPDLAVNRSMALHMKMSIQRDRNYQRSLADDAGWFRKKLAGWFDE